MSSNTFIALALLENDDFALLLATESKRLEKSDPIIFNFQSIEPERCKVNFRFEKNDIPRFFLP